MSNVELADRASGEGPVPPSPDAGAGAPDESPSDAPPSLRDEILKARDEVRAKEADNDTSSIKKDATGRAHAPDGKFAPKTAAPDKVEAATIQPVAQPDAKPEAVSTPPSGPPPGWSQEAKTEFAKLSPAIQAAVVKREQEVSDGFKQYEGLKQRHNEFEQVLSPIRQEWQSQGITDVQAVGNFVGWQKALRDPRIQAQAFTELARLVGFDLSTVTSAGDASQDEFQNDPALYALRQEIASLKAGFGQVTQTFEQQEDQRLRQELANFENEKDASGVLLHPHYKKVMVNMGRLMSAGIVRQDDLTGAYQKATSLDPEVQAEIQRTEAQKRELEAAQAALKRPTPLQRPLQVRSSAPNAGGPSVKETRGSLRDDLKEAFAAARG